MSTNAPPAVRKVILWGLLSIASARGAYLIGASLGMHGYGATPGYVFSFYGTDASPREQATVSYMDVLAPPLLWIHLPPHESHFLASGLTKTFQVPGYFSAFSPITRVQNAPATCFYVNGPWGDDGKREVKQMPSETVKQTSHNLIRVVGTSRYPVAGFHIFVPDRLRLTKSAGFDLFCASEISAGRLNFTDRMLFFSSDPISLTGIKAHDYGFVVKSDSLWDASNIRAAGVFSTSSKPGYQVPAGGSVSLSWTDPDSQTQRDYMLVYLGLVAGIAATFLIEALRPIVDKLTSSPSAAATRAESAQRKTNARRR